MADCAAAGGNAPPEQRTVVLDREAEERPLPRPRNRTLFRVDLELETSFDEAGQAHHDPPAGLFTADVDVTIISISHNSVAATIELAVQFSEHEVREQGRERTAL